MRATNVEDAPLQRKRLVLDFHGLGERPAGVEPDEAYYWCDDPVRFHRLLDTIAPATAATGTPVEITFDDGNMSDATIGVPALVDRGLTASFFICAGRIGSAGYLDRAALADMLGAGMAIGSHGWGHVDWRKIDDATLTVEVDDAADRIEQTIGARVDSVAIPFGSYDRRVLGRLGRFATLYSSDGGLADPAQRILPRESFRQDWGDDAIAVLAAPTAAPFASITRRLSAIYKSSR